MKLYYELYYEFYYEREHTFPRAHGRTPHREPLRPLYHDHAPPAVLHVYHARDACRDPNQRGLQGAAEITVREPPPCQCSENFTLNMD